MKHPPFCYCTIASLALCLQVHPFRLSFSTQEPAIVYTSQENASVNMAYSYFNIRLAYYFGFAKHMYQHTSQLSTILRY